MRALLDVSTLIAALDERHLHHATVRSWLEANAAHGWASCPITQNGCLRIMNAPGYPNTQPLDAVAARLRAATATPLHEFWPGERKVPDA